MQSLVCIHYYNFMHRKHNLPKETLDNNRNKKISCDKKSKNASLLRFIRLFSFFCCQKIIFSARLPLTNYFSALV